MDETLDVFIDLDQDGWMLKEAVGFAYQHSKVKTRMGGLTIIIDERTKSFG